jgi:hypothetical protein
MSTPQFQTDRREALRRQLVQLPTLAGAEDPVRYRRPKDSLHHDFRGGDRAEHKVAQPKSPYRSRRVLLTAAAATVGILAVGQTSITVQSAHAAVVLRAAAQQSMTFIDPVPAPGQYLLVHTRANWLGAGQDESGNTETYMSEQRIDVYVPGDPHGEWVLDREWGPAGPMPGHDQRIRARNGEFYDGMLGMAPWTKADMDALPRDGQALRDHFNAQYRGGSASRDEDSFVRITDLLRSGLVPADLRAGLYDALALIPGVTASEHANLDGKAGVAIGRTEPLRGGLRAEIIIDPNTGLVIGERGVMTHAAFGFGLNEVLGHTAIDYQIIDSAP